MLSCSSSCILSICIGLFMVGRTSHLLFFLFFLRCGVCVFIYVYLVWRCWFMTHETSFVISFHEYATYESKIHNKLMKLMPNAKCMLVTLINIFFIKEYEVATTCVLSCFSIETANIFPRNSAQKIIINVGDVLAFEHFFFFFFFLVILFSGRLKERTKEWCKGTERKNEKKRGKIFFKLFGSKIYL